MGKYVTATILTVPGIASNNRGSGDGSNLMTLQKLSFKDKVFTTVSAEAIRWAYREYFQELYSEQLNRTYDVEIDCYNYKDESNPSEAKFLDDDIFGYMSAKKSGTIKRRGVLELTRAVSIHTDKREQIFNAVAGDKGSNSLYNAEVHYTQYQYTASFKVDDLKVKDRATLILDAMFNLRHVGGNHARYLYDFNPQSIVLRVSSAPACGIIGVFDSNGTLAKLRRLVSVGDIDPNELIVGGLVSESQDGIALDEMGVTVCPGIQEALNTAKYAVTRG